MSNFFSILFAIIKAIPIINSWADKFVAFYVQKGIEQLKKEDREAIRKAINEQDQRDLEKQLGSTTAGELSGIPGTDIRTDLPNVGGVQSPEKK